MEVELPPGYNLSPYSGEIGDVVDEVNNASNDFRNIGAITIEPGDERLSIDIGLNQRPTSLDIIDEPEFINRNLYLPMVAK